LRFARKPNASQSKDSVCTRLAIAVLDFPKTKSDTFTFVHVAIVPEPSETRHVLSTGASGFLGAVSLPT
jgi:hypothetical protein